MQGDLHSLISHLIQNFHSPRLAFHRQEAGRIHFKYSPRQVFNRWRDSEEGKTWKLKEYQRIDSICPVCQCSLPSIQHFVIDHIKPIKTHPDLAVDQKNLRLLCNPCNLRKGAN